MTYASRTDLEDRYGVDELEQRESVLPAGAVGRALSDADAEVDGYVAGAYNVPLSPVPSNIVRIAAAIARYRLLGDAATEQTRADYEDAIRFLRDVQSGRARLMSAAPIAGGTPAATIAVTTGGKVFARGSNGGLAG
jgi:phage gp36-like protein